jgi:hypothetical protein
LLAPPPSGDALPPGGVGRHPDTPTPSQGPETPRTVGQFVGATQANCHPPTRSPDRAELRPVSRGSLHPLLAPPLVSPRATPIRSPPTPAFALARGGKVAGRGWHESNTDGGGMRSAGRMMWLRRIFGKAAGGASPWENNRLANMTPEWALTQIDAPFVRSCARFVVHLCRKYTPASSDALFSGRGHGSLGLRVGKPPPKVPAAPIKDPILGGWRDFVGSGEGLGADRQCLGGRWVSWGWNRAGRRAGSEGLASWVSLRRDPRDGRIALEVPVAYPGGTRCGPEQTEWVARVLPAGPHS